jgi:hypothetical protein
MARRWSVGGMVFLCVVMLASGCKKAEWAEFTSKEGRFKVQMPGTPRQKSEFAAGVDLRMFVVEQTGGAYVVAYADLPILERETAQQTQIRLDGARDGCIRNVNGSLTNETRITLEGKFPGRDIKANLPEKKGLMRNKIFVVNQRFYQVLVIGPPEWTNSAEAKKFMESFALTP